jgi:L-threonylcarbamoyladenylate synthase
VLADLNSRIDAVLDAGPTTVGLESTVLDPTQTPMVLYRPGAVTAEHLTAATGVPVYTFVPPESIAPHQSLPSPGVGLRHYAPRATLHLVEGNAAALAAALNAATLAPETIGVLLPTDWSLKTRAVIQPWANWEDPDAIAATLFASLRALDDLDVQIIFAPLPPPGGLRDAVRDRMHKAARS